jgi:NAD(P)-dependent dehydrogenase (short-subunit alcohol dehydrogenase family)
MDRSRVVFFTGATSGFGRIAACKLAEQGDRVVAAVRNKSRAEELLAFFYSHYPKAKGRIETVECDLTDFNSVVNAVSNFSEKYASLDLLVNNAGIMNKSLHFSKNGIEETFQVNFLAPLLFTFYFLPLLSAAQGKIINSSSSFHHGTINFNDIEGKRLFSGFNAYRQSKLATLLVTNMLKDDFQASDVKIYNQHPGIVFTNLGRDSNILFRFGLELLGVSPEKGAETLLFLANTPAHKLTNGGFYAQCKKWKTKPDSNNMKLAANVYDLALKYLNPFLPDVHLYTNNSNE